MTRKIKYKLSIGSENDQFLFPFDVCTDGAGNILVSDTYNSRVSRFTQQGKFIDSIDNMFQSPTGICLNPKTSQLIVCDREGDNIKIFSQDLRLLRTVPCSHSPSFVTSNRKGEIFVCNNSGFTRVLDSNGQFIRNLGQLNGGSPIRVDGPRGICCNSRDEVVLADYPNDQILLMDERLVHACKRDTKLVPPLWGPRGVCVDQEDNIIASDGIRNRLVIFDRNGQFMRQQNLSSRERFHDPYALCVIENNIIVVELIEKKISIFFT